MEIMGNREKPHNRNTQTAQKKARNRRSGEWGLISMNRQHEGVSAAQSVTVGVWAAPECGRLGSTRMWGSHQHQNVGLGVSEAPECGGLSSSEISKGVWAAPKGSQQRWEVGGLSRVSAF